ncbi:MAG: tyrosine-type recombinase/integrase [Bacteroidales bacterium]|nr:tyrosine-type recombinase/integrase [Bacteroidales bacterium]
MNRKAPLADPAKRESAAMLNSRTLFSYVYEWVHEYLPNYRSGSGHTVRSYAKTVNLFMFFLKGKGATVSTLSASNFSPDTIREWLQWLKDVRGNSGTTINTRLAIIKSLLHYFAIRDASLVHLWTESQIVEKVDAVPKDVTGITMDALAALLEAIDDSTRIGLRDYVIVILLYGLGARIDECLSLKMSDIVLGEKGKVTLHGKGSKVRTLSIPCAVTEALEQYVSVFHGKRPDPGRLLFYSPVHGLFGKLSQECIRKRLRMYAEKAHSKCEDVPLDLAAHRLRHTRANQWRREGFNIAEIQSLLGHSSIETTMKYQKVTEEEKRSALERFGVETEADVKQRWDVEMVDDLIAALGVK